ncbi:MAG TPA: hypothetical protein VNM72_08530 [Blastocatellia bacterium]|nr:hypothetical protein [Blastocatellia bacterium]
MIESKKLLLEKLSDLSPQVDLAIVLQDLALLDPAFHSLSQEKRATALAEALRDRKFFATYEECVEMVSLWMESKALYGSDTRALLDDVNARRLLTFTPKMSPSDRSVESGKDVLLRELIRKLIAGLQSSCSWGERGLVSVERDGVLEMLSLLRLLVPFPELYDFATATIQEMFDQLEAERREVLAKNRRQLHRQVQREIESDWGEHEDQESS